MVKVLVVGVLVGVLVVGGSVVRVPEFRGLWSGF